MAGNLSIVLNVSNVDKSSEAYRNLGFKVAPQSMGEMKFAVASLGGVDLVLFPNEAPWLTEEDRAWLSGELGKGVLLSVEAKDVDGFWRRAQRSGFSVDKELQADPDGGGRGFMLQDPDGYVLSVHEPYGVDAPKKRAAPKRKAAARGAKRTGARKAAKRSTKGRK